VEVRRLRLCGLRAATKSDAAAAHLVGAVSAEADATRVIRVMSVQQGRPGFVALIAKGAIVVFGGTRLMARCPQCNLLLSGYSSNCPRCGRPLRARFRIWAVGIAIIVFLVVLVAAVRSSGWLSLEAYKLSSSSLIKSQRN